MEDTAASYDHTQKGMAALAFGGLALGLIAVITVPMFVGSKRGITLALLPAILIGLVVIATLIIFTRLRVRIANGELQWTFGFGFPKFALPLAEIAAAHVVTNSILYGFGIRVIPKGMLYNISGPAAVEVVKRDGHVVRIGTDEPAALLAAIESGIEPV